MTDTTAANAPQMVTAKVIDGPHIGKSFTVDSRRGWIKLAYLPPMPCRVGPAEADSTHFLEFEYLLIPVFSPQGHLDHFVLSHQHRSAGELNAYLRDRRHVLLRTLMKELERQARSGAGNLYYLRQGATLLDGKFDLRLITEALLKLDTCAPLESENAPN